jgi:hypothetical protein
VKSQKREYHVCPACGKRKLSIVPAWCDCNPKAPFRMVPSSVKRTVDSVLGKRGNK